MSGSLKQLLRSPLFLIVGAVLLWFSITFLIYPNVRLLGTVFMPEGEFTFDAIRRLVSSQRAMDALRNSFLLAVVLSITVNAVGIFIVLATRYFDIKGARILWLGYASTLIYGGIVLVAGYKFIYGDSGFITRLLLNVFPDMNPAWFSGMFAVVFVMTFACTGNHLLFLGNALDNVDFQTIEAARMMGASNWNVLRKIVLPTLMPTVYAITILTFLGGLGALAAPQVLGGEDFQTVTPMILTFANVQASRDLAATLAIILGLSTIALLAVMNRLEKGGTYFSISKVPASMQKQKIDNPVANVVVHTVAYALFAVYALPPVLIVIFSFTDASSIQNASLNPGSFTLDNYLRVFTDYAALWPFLVSIGYSAAAAVVVVFGLVFVARLVQKFRNPVTAAIEYVLHIPWILPSTMVALGLIVAFDHSEWLVGNAVLTGTLAILAIAYVIGKIPFTLRMLKAAFAAVPDQLEEAASILGAGSFTTFRRILLPIVAPTAAAIAALNFNSLLDDYDTAVFLAHPLYQPLGIVIKNATSEDTLSDTTALTFVYTVVLMVITGVSMWLVYGRDAGNRRHRSGPPPSRRPSQAPAPAAQEIAPEPLELATSGTMNTREK
ncbi:iron(III) transport system permease protein [Arthrobacter sp. 1088]|uniref:ABC transporter permease n=1 Tax=Arthrobacter sp. 1088 TaxID=2817768 RepID=UPI00286179EC|nr:iron ABC transporter permease [Arthrobacter sp. 1088]MDR6687743.1 iron(III) transport system permease protein [Arthrobacter sp. 1088]